MRKYALHTLFEIDGANPEYFTEAELSCILGEFMPMGKVTVSSNEDVISGVAMDSDMRLSVTIFVKDNYIAADLFSTLSSPMAVEDSADVLTYLLDEFEAESSFVIDLNRGVVEDADCGCIKCGENVDKIADGKKGGFLN